VGVQIDEPGGDDEPRSIEHLGGVGRRHPADLGDAPVFDGHVGAAAGDHLAVDDHAALDDLVIKRCQGIHLA
jgi:hypothetical protein